jgi:rhamnosyltransferase
VSVRVVVSVDPGSDDSESWLRQASSKDPRVHVLSGTERFGSAALNFYRLLRDADLINSDFVAFADQDDVWFPWKLQRAVHRLRAEAASGYSSNVLAWAPGRDPHILRKSNRQTKWDYLFSSPGPGCTHVITTSFALELRELIRTKFDLVRQIEYHDWLDYAYARSHGHQWIIDDEPTMLYRQHASNQLGANSGIRAAMRRLEDIRRGWLWEQAHLIGTATGSEGAPPLRLLSDLSLIGRLQFLMQSTQMRRGRLDSLVLGTAGFLRGTKSGTARGELPLR